MKKTVSILLILLAFLIIYFLQANVFTWFNIAGARAGADVPRPRSWL